MPALRLILIGPPGSGKGTQATRLCERYQIGHVSTGDILRRNTQKGTELGRHAQEYLRAGDLVPDELVFDMLEDLYNRVGGEHQGFVLDGFPRSEHQAVELSEFLEARTQPISAVLLLKLPDDEIVERLVHRRTCPKCGRSYHLKASPPAQDGVCDADGTALIWRADDHEEVIRNRLHTYHAQTEPVAQFYEKKGLLSSVDALAPIGEITERLCQIIDKVRDSAESANVGG